MPLIRYYESDDAEKAFDRRVKWTVRFAVTCLIAGTVLTHFAH